MIINNSGKILKKFVLDDQSYQIINKDLLIQNYSLGRPCSSSTILIVNIHKLPMNNVAKM